MAGESSCFRRSKYIVGFILAAAIWNCSADIREEIPIVRVKNSAGPMYGSPAITSMTKDGMVFVHYDLFTAHTQQQIAREDRRARKSMERLQKTSMIELNAFENMCEIADHIQTIAHRKLPVYVITNSKSFADLSTSNPCIKTVYEVHTLAELKNAIRELRKQDRGILFNTAFSVLDKEYNKRLYPQFITSLFAKEHHHIDVSYVNVPNNLSVTIFSTDPIKYVLNVDRIKALGYDVAHFLPHAKGLNKGRRQ